MMHTPEMPTVDDKASSSAGAYCQVEALSIDANDVLALGVLAQGTGGKAIVLDNPNGCE